MNLQKSQPSSVEHSGERKGSEMRLQGRWLLIARVSWIVLTLLILNLNVVMIPRYFVVLQAHCAPGPQCFALQVTAYDRQLLHQFGLSLGFVAAYQVMLDTVSVLVCCALGALLFWRKSADRMALFCAFMLVLFGGAGFTSILQDALAPLSAVWFALVGTLDLLGQSSFMIFFFLFPTGRFVPRWTRWIAPCFVLYWIYTIFISNEFSQFSWSGLVFIALLLCIVAAQVYRYRRVSTSRERLQTKWVVFGFSIGIVGFILSVVLANTIGNPFLSLSSVFNTLVGGTILYGFLLLIPISIATAILRYRLYNIDIIIRRTLLYGMLTACVVALYVLVVVGLGALLQARGNLGLSLLATGLIAVLIQPLHTRLQRAVNHLLYGERDEPYTVISRLGQRLEATLAPEAVLPTIVETVTQALKLPYAAISLKQDGEDVITASSGKASNELTSLPLVYQGEHLGDLLLAPRARGETFSSADRDLLADLARQAGIAIHGVRLTTDLQRLTNELQRSRTQIVTAREEERRRLRRDLHDGLGSVLASLNWRAGALRLLLPRDPVAADALVVEQQTTIQAAIGDIRRLVYDLRPPALDELGLVGAIRERAAKQRVPKEGDSALGLCVDVVTPEHLPALPAAVEVAAYRIVQEALTNVVHHAHPQRCRICLSCENDMLHVEVSDDGIGLPESYRAGVGLLSMRERATELGGSCEIAPMQEGGTCVRACLPILKNDQQL